MLRQQSEVEVISAQESLISSTERVALKRVLACPAQHRSQQELLPVHRVLQKVEFVAKLDLKVQEDLANIVFYEHFEPFTTVFKEASLNTTRKSTGPSPFREKSARASISLCLDRLPYRREPVF